MTEFTISKSQYVKGLQCNKAFWLARNRKDLGRVTPQMQAFFDVGKEVGKLAQQCYPNGVAVKDPYWDIDGAINTTDRFVAEKQPIIFEAASINPADGTYCRIDILKYVPESDQWDMIEVKSSTGVKDYHYDDVAFQYRVFTTSGYNIRKCQLMLIEKQYFRRGDIEPHELFNYVDITQQVIGMQDQVDEELDDMIAIRDLSQEPSVAIGSQCTSPFDCSYKSYCWSKVPDYSVFNIFQGEEADKVFLQYGAELENLPSYMHPTGNKLVELNSYLSKTAAVNVDNIKGFLSQLEYPLYFLDYETVMQAIPLFDGIRPYQKIPFQFSLHRQDVPGGELHHSEYLHRERSDPRLSFIRHLLDGCGDKGSIIVYYKPFETSCNNDLAERFTEYADDINAISDRFVDLLEPFGRRWIYHPEQKGSASLKSILPAFTGLGYGTENGGIASGDEAMRAYAKFLCGKTEEQNLDQLWGDLSRYCTLDTFAMVKLLEVLQKSATGQVEG